MRLNYTCDIAASQERVWSLISEPEQQKKWMPALVSHVQLDDGPTLPGSRFEAELRTGEQVTKFPGEFTAYRPPFELGMRYWLKARGSGQTFLVRYLLTSRPGQTHLDYHYDFEIDHNPWLQRMFQFLAQPLMKSYVRRQTIQNFGRLKFLAEEGRLPG
jgi:uncharacterized protein YndB with AHSA1/START domain